MPPTDEEIEAFIAHALMNETKSYLERGRALKERGDEELKNLWAALVERW